MSVLFAASSASAAANINHLSNGDYQVQYPHQTTAYITVEWRLGSTFVESTTCVFTCPTSPPGGGSYDQIGYVLTYDSNTVELVGESCSGTVLGVGRCANGNYVASLRPYLGDLNFAVRGNDGLALNMTGINLRYHFADDKYWDRIGIGDLFPVGTYDVEILSYTALSHCSPVPDAVSYPATIELSGPSPETAFNFNGTNCTFEFQNDSTRIIDVSSNGVAGTCQAAVGAKCSLSVPWRANVLFSASAGDGYTAQFNHSTTPCSEVQTFDRSKCREEKAERDWKNTADLNMTVVDNATAKALVASLGSAPPADRTAAKGENGVVVAHMHVEPRNAPATMQVLYVSVSGSSDPNDDFPMVRVYDDTNNNGLVNVGEELLGSQVMAITGTSFVTLNESITGPRNLVVTVDIADQIAATVSLPGAPWSLISVVLVPIIVLFRRRRVAMGLAAVVVLVGVAYACGGDDGGEEDTDDDQHQSDTDLTDDDSNDGDTTDDDGDDGGGDNAGGDNAGGDNSGDSGGGDVDPPPGAAVFEFRIDGFTVPNGTLVEGIPVNGATITVSR